MNVPRVWRSGHLGKGVEMLPELAEIRKKRKSFGFTQTGLSKKAGVSQSLIAKIESGAIVPSYSNAKKIFDFFESLHEGTQVKAREFMTAKVLSVDGNDSVKSAARLMERHSVSQLPVLSDGRNLGTISEKTILERMNREGDAEKVLSKKVEEIMDEAMPQITEDSPFELVSSILSHYPGAVVMKKGKVVGIITKADLLKAAVMGKK